MKVIRHSNNNVGYPIGSNFLPNLNVCKELANNIMCEFPHNKIQFICTGSSGAIIAALVAQHIPTSRICHVKKEGEKSHCTASIESNNDFIKIIIDDFTSTGSTVNRLITYLNNFDSEERHLALLGDDNLDALGNKLFQWSSFETVFLMRSWEDNIIIESI